MTSERIGGTAGDEPAGGIDDSWFDVPNCEDCLTPMRDAETASGAVYWSCPACGRARVA